MLIAAIGHPTCSQSVTTGTVPQEPSATHRLRRQSPPTHIPARSIDNRYSALINRMQTLQPWRRELSNLARSRTEDPHVRSVEESRAVAIRVLLLCKSRVQTWSVQPSPIHGADDRREPLSVQRSWPGSLRVVPQPKVTATNAAIAIHPTGLGAARISQGGGPHGQPLLKSVGHSPKHRCSRLRR